MIKSIVTFLLSFAVVYWLANDVTVEGVFMLALFMTGVAVAADVVTAVIEGYRNGPDNL